MSSSRFVTILLYIATGLVIAAIIIAYLWK